MKWQILIPHMPHRHAQLVGLLDVLAAQMQPGVEVLIYSDNLEADYPTKLQALADASTAEYTSHLANDDSVSDNFVPRVLEALTESPDYVGFRVRYTLDGVPQQPVIHSLQCGCWSDMPHLLMRDLMYYNPIRRELAQQVQFRGPYCDMEWADDLRGLGVVKTEAFIDDELLYYQRKTADNFHSSRQPLPADQVPPLPSTEIYPFVRYLEP